MMSCTASAAWSHHVSSPFYTEHGQHCGAVMLGRITTVAMSKSSQLGLRCTVEPNCSAMFARLAGALVTCNCTLDTCEHSCVSGAGRPFFIPVVHSLLGDVGYVAAPELSSRGGEVGVTWQHRSPPRQGSEVRGRGTCGGSGAHLCREVWSEGTAYVAARECTSCSLS
jgi:hypothetical protein